MAQFHEANVELTRRGFSVITISMALPRETRAEISANKPLKEVLDLVHFNKILRSDAVFVVMDESEYIGFSTAREIIWANMQGKPVFWMARWLKEADQWDRHAEDLRNEFVDDPETVLGLAKEALSR